MSAAMSAFRRWAVALALVGSSACPPRVPTPSRALEDALDDVADGQASARAWALSGLHALFASSDVEKARVQLERAVEQDRTDPWALWGQLQLAERQTRSETAVGIALDCVERNPEHPLAAVSARFVLDHVLFAQQVDDEVLTRAPRLLEQRLSADAAHLLRAAVAAISEARGDDAKVASTLEDMGVPTSVSLVGPFSAWHVLTAGEPVKPEATGDLSGPLAGPFGPLTPRTFSVADGRMSLDGEGPMGDVFLLGFDLDVTEPGPFVLRTVTSMDHTVVLNGATVLSRSTWQRPGSTLAARAVVLEAGRHRLLVRAARHEQAGHFQVAVQRLDGRPAKLRFTAATGPAPAWGGVKLPDSAEGVWVDAAAVHAALEEEGGDALARLVATRDGVGRDRDGARRILAGLDGVFSGALVHQLRAELELADKLAAPKVAKGRATRELEAALAKDGSLVAARALSAQLELDEGRPVDALERIRQARAMYPSSWVLWLQARIELSLGLDAQAVITAKEALANSKGHCESLMLHYDVARRRDAVAESDELLEATKRCPGAPSRMAEHLRVRANLKEVTALWRKQLARDESQTGAAISLSNALVAQQAFDEALQVLRKSQTLWPRNAQLLKQEADVLERSGRLADALAVRERALALDGADLALRRSIERAKTGKELLDDHAITSAAALKAYEAAPGSEEANAAFLLDAAAIEAFPDGTQVDRVHILQKALDQAGVEETAEVQLPSGAVVLKLRTLKPDGTSLEPENIEGKDAVSLPGVQVGDVVEYEYLLAHPPRGPGQPGFTASNFYFQVARQPNNWSTYTVIAPKGSGMQVDAHNLKNVAPVRTEGDKEIFFHEEKRVPPYIPEPMGPPASTEWLPYVSVGAGQKGTEGLMLAYADAFLDRGAVTFEVEQFARQAAGAAKGLEAVKAVYAGVMKRLSGRDAGLGMSAASSVGQDRGSRTWLLVSALTALGFEARLVAVRAFMADPAPSIFPNESAFPYLCIRVTVPGAEPVWLDPMVRFAPFGELPEFALGEREAYVLPLPGRPLEKTTTPKRSARPSKTVKLEARLDAEGVLEGTGTETYFGFEAAQLGEALEQLSVDQRKQAIEQALSRMFGGADLKSVDVALTREVGATVTVKYAFSASRFGRKEGSTMVLSALTFPWNLGRRFLVVSQRVTPLFLEASESTKATVTLTVPSGYRLKDPMPEAKSECPWGSYVRREAQQGTTVTIEEEARLIQSRVPPNAYEQFGEFAGATDLLQGKDVLLVTE
jgi:tetratricopeptide (TPR) repeat protein